MTDYRKKFSAPLLITLAVLAGAGLAMGTKDRPAEAAAETKAESADFTAAQKEAMGPVIHDYLVSHPEVIMEAFDAYQKKQEATQQQQFKDKLSEVGDKVFTSGAPTAGSKTADVRIAEFYDYNCGYCKKATEDVVGLLKDDPNVQFVFLDMPILSPSSADAARWALAADKQGKYYEYYVALMHNAGPRSTETFEKVGKDLGLDVEKLRKDADEDKSIREAIEKNMALSRDLGIRGTPAFIIEDQMIPGYVGLDGLKQAVAQAREKKKKQ